VNSGSWIIPLPFEMVGQPGAELAQLFSPPRSDDDAVVAIGVPVRNVTRVVV